MMSTAFRTFSTEKCPNHYVSDDTSVVLRISLDDFYASVTDFTISDEEALKYMTFAAKMAMVRFKDEEEMLDFKGDFQAALAFIQKLDDVDARDARFQGCSCLHPETGRCRRQRRGAPGKRARILRW